MCKKFSFGLAFFLSLTCFAGQVFSSPNLHITTAVQSADEIVISGSGFESHADQSPLLSEIIGAAWNNFESGEFDTGGFYLTPDYPENWQLTSAGANRNGSSYYASKSNNNGRLGAYYHGINGNGGTVYSSFWFMMPSGTQSGKFARVYADSSRNAYFSSGGENTQVRGYAENVDASTVWGSPDAFSSGVWRRVDILNEAGGDTTVWIDGKLQWTRQWFYADTNFNGHTYDIGNMIDSGSGSYNFDDIYVSYTLARVEICDSATWNDNQARHCEVQPPFSWSPSGNSITVKANNGSFNTGNTAYLYVIDGDGNVSNNGQGVEIVVGEGGGVTPPPTDNNPTVAFTSPTTGSNYSVEITGEQEIIILAGTANDDNSVQSVTYSTDNGQNGNASTGDGFDTWSLPVTVNKDETVIITVTVTDDAGQSTNKPMTITSTSTSTFPVGWDSYAQTGDSTWTDSSVTYSVRLLIEGASVEDNAGQVLLGFQGRSSGDYTIRNVSIAERDSAGSEGDVIDNTWTQVTFDSAAWNNSVTVGAGVEKLSDPASIQLKTGADYYVTFKIDSPSVYLEAPSGYRELYFASADHTSDVDWSGNGYSVTQDYHALSRIYVYSSDGGPPPGDMAPQIINIFIK